MGAGKFYTHLKRKICISPNGALESYFHILAHYTQFPVEKAGFLHVELFFSLPTSLFWSLIEYSVLSRGRGDG